MVKFTQTSKMKILFLTRSYLPNIGGVEKHVEKLTEILIQNGHEVSIITEKSHVSYSNNYHSTSVSARSMENNKKPKIIRIKVGEDSWFKKFRIWLKLFAYIKVIMASDVVHCHDVFFWYLAFKFIFPFKKVYTTFHGYEGNKIPNSRAIFMHKISEKLSSGNICIGDLLKKWYGTKPTYVSYGAVDLNLIKFNENSVNKEKDIIFAGRLEEETGVLEYLKAIYLLKTKGIDLSVDVYGDGSLKKQAMTYVTKYNLNVKFMGFVSNVTDYIPKYKMIFVSRYLGILESLALRIPIFAQYNNSIKKDYLYMSPFAKYMFIASTGEEIAIAIEKYINKDLSIDTKGGYEWVKDKTWENMVNIYLKLWK